MSQTVHALEELEEQQCWSLLASVPIARLAFSEHALPRVTPMHFTVRGSEVYLGGPTSARVADAVRGSVVAVEVDGYDLVTQEGWTVTVVGQAREVVEPDEIAELDALDFAPSCADRRACYLAVGITVLRGHRLLRRPAPATDAAAVAAAVL